MSHDERDVETLCEVMHDAYEAAATREGWETQERSRKPWADVPEANKATMRAAVRAVLDALDVPGRERRARAEGAQEALARAIQAHRDLHPIYGSTAVCRGGIGGQMVTQHCAWTCDNPSHRDAQAAWEAVEESHFRAAEIDPEEADDDA